MQAGFFPFFVKTSKCLVRHEDLSANFQHHREGSLQSKRQAGNSSEVCSDLVSGQAISTGSAVSKSAIPVNQRSSNPVDFWLDGYGDAFSAKVLLQPLVKIQNLSFGKYVVDGEHRNWMVHLIEPLERGSAYPSRRGVRVI